jgi:hypothetical protein
VTAGRPPKFAEPSSPVTLTLPHRILRQLEMLDGDRGKAIVKCVEALTATALTEGKRVEIVKISDNSGLIVIGPCKSLAEIDWLRLVEIAPARFLLSLPSGTDVSSLEVAIMDVIEHLPAGESSERKLLEELRSLIAHHRRLKEVTKGEILFVEI